MINVINIPKCHLCLPWSNFRSWKWSKLVLVETPSIYSVRILTIFFKFEYCCFPKVYFLLYINFMVPFYGWGSTSSRLEPLRGGSSLFTTKFPEIPGTHFIDLGRMNGWVDLGDTQWFWTRDPWIGNPVP